MIKKFIYIFMVGMFIVLTMNTIQLKIETKELLEIANENFISKAKQIEIKLPPAAEYIESSEKEILAKLLYCEAGSMSWDCQVYTCSAILNMKDRTNKTIWEMAHNKNLYSVAEYVDGAKPKQIQYEVIDYVLNGGRIPEICYFRTDYYHSFGTPVCEVGGHYFSKP